METEARLLRGSLEMTPALEACGRKPTGRGEAPQLLSAASRAPVGLPIYTSTLSVFIIHISCGRLA